MTTVPKRELSDMRKLDGFVRNATSDWWADMLARRTGELVWIGELVADQVHIVHQAARPEDLVHAVCVTAQALSEETSSGAPKES